MPSSSKKTVSDRFNFDNFDDEEEDTFKVTEDVGKLKVKKSKKKNDTTLVAEPTSQEKATKSVVNHDEYSLVDRHVKSRNTDSISQTISKNPFSSPIPSQASQHTYTSPLFAALGDAFREIPPPHKPPEVAGSPSPPSPVTSPPLQEPRARRAVFTAPVIPKKQEIFDHSPPSARAQPTSNQVEEIRGGFSHHSPPTISPRLAYRQLSRRPSGYQYQQEALGTSPRGRPVSMPSQLFHLPTPSGFNLNQMRGIANDVLGDNSRSTSRKASKYNFTALDSLTSAGDNMTGGSENVLLAAHDNSLHVFHLARDKATRLGKIDGLRGYVVAAKIIPSPNRRDPLYSLRPLVAVIVHGPEMMGEDLSRPSSRHSDHSFDPSYPHDARAMPSLTKYQTSVEVYSLKHHTHVATLYATVSEEPKVENVFGKKSYELPGPIGNLSVHVTDCYIAVVSIESGEVYLYDIHSGRPEQRFRCIGKTWTSVPPKKSRTWSSSSAPEEEVSRDGLPNQQRHEAPLIALRGRLLAYVPPVSSSRSTIFGRVRIPGIGKEAPGLKSHTASSQPTSTCQVETPLDGSKVNELARGVTQEMLKGAKWVGDQGMQAWKNYWSPKSPELNPQFDFQQQNHQFPPTHASDDLNRVAQQPTIISFLDLDKLSASQNLRPDLALQPIASFVLHGGCSFMNLTPSGLGLLTASAKGDVQNVWDLMQIMYPRQSGVKNSGLKSEHTSVIRQIARFTRITTACIVDVAWLGSRGSKLAILTDRGTVHLHDLPLSALDWPPLPVKRTALPDVRSSNPTSQTSMPTGWGSAFSAASTSAQTITAVVRSNPLSQFSKINLAQASAGAGAKGGKIVAAGFSRSVEAASGTVSSIMSIGETRLHVPGISKLVVPGSARWWSSRDVEAIAVVGDGVVRVHKVLLKKESKQTRRLYSVVGERIAEIAIPEPIDKRESEWELVNDGFETAGEWSAGPQPRKHSRSRSVTNPLSSAEIETNAPYQPLYTDPRIEFETYNDESYAIYGTWAFGQTISSEPLSNVVQRRTTAELDIPPQVRESIMSLVEQIEDDLPIPDSPPRSKIKKSKKSKGKASRPIPEPEPELEIEAEDLPWGHTEADDLPWGRDFDIDEDMNDLMRL